MSIKRARSYLARLRWRVFFGHKKSIKRQGYVFKAHMGRQYGRNAVWVLSNGKLVYMAFCPQQDQAMTWVDYQMCGLWIDPHYFRAITGIDPNGFVVQEDNNAGLQQKGHHHRSQHADASDDFGDDSSD